METVDSNKDLLARESSLAVSSILKLEIAFAVLFFIENSIELAMALAVACVCVNQLTEIYYVKKTTFRQKLLILLKSLLVTLCIYLTAYLIHVEFIFSRHGETRIDSYKIWLVAKLLAFVFIFLATLRLSAVGGDCLINWHRQNKKPKAPIV